MIENGQSISTISQSLGIGENLIYRWKSKQKKTVKAAVKGEKSDFSLKLLEENESLKEKVKQLETERDIWTSRRASASGSKKALSIFSRMI